MSPSGLVERAIAAQRGWPVRWRLAAVSAALTLVILLGFAAIVGRLTSDRLESDFREDLRSTTNELALKIQLAGASGQDPSVQPGLSDFTLEEGAHARVITDSGEVLGESDENTPDFGPPDAGEIESVGPYKVATTHIATTRLGLQEVFVQYGRDHGDVQATIDRLWLFLGAGVLIGTGLAYLAGHAVAIRAMRPISSLTAAAKEIAWTRDPSRRIPALDTDDEVAELARTLEEML